ncbi:MAG: 30S ribosomal protein S2 [Planctomycetes bacterium]|nr:30S ribosomal protein S2 [Planctomycetota bacterium]MBI3833032.1 30S ribosomal protein S2 [Planctomycetota bacterium]
MASELVRQLVDSGIHYGHRVSRWNPKMLPYIYGKRNTIHIIDIRETVKGLLRAKKFIAQIVAKGDDILFVGTKRQAKLLVQQQASRVGMPHVTERWLGGTLTNFRTIRSRLQRLEELEREEADGTLMQYSKKMIASRQRETKKIRRNLDGVRSLTRLPGALVIIDVHREHNAVKEAKKLKIPTICLIDTDSDPDFADIPIPGNDDAIRAIDTILMQLADAVDEGKRGRMAMEAVNQADGAGKRRPPRRSRDEGETPNDRPVGMGGGADTATRRPDVDLTAVAAGPDDSK